jgi:hypothetical protein
MPTNLHQPRRKEGSAKRIAEFLLGTTFWALAVVCLVLAIAFLAMLLALVPVVLELLRFVFS